jgi:hypothetical protein
MRTSIRAKRSRLLTLVAGVLVAGTALATTTMPAQALTPPPPLVTVTNPGPQTTTPLGTEVGLQIEAVDSNPLGLLTYTSTELPPGLVINPATGLIHGVATGVFDGPVTVTATDQDDDAGSATFDWVADNAITVAAPGNQTTPLGTDITPLPISATDNGGLGTVLTWTAANLPTGLAIDPVTGIIAGTATAVGIYLVTVTATDASGSTGNTAFTWKVGNIVTVHAPATEKSPAGVAIKPVTITATDSTAGLKYTYSAAGLPAGLAIAPTTGVISGTPTAAPKTYAVTVTVTDSTESTGTAVIQWTIGKQNTVAISATVPKVIYHGVLTTVKVTVKDSDTTQKTFAWAVGKLPPGLGAKASGSMLVISGRPTRDALFMTAITATDGTGAKGATTLRFDVANAITVVDLYPKLTSTAVGAGTFKEFTTKDAIKGEKIVKVTATGLPPGMVLSQNPITIYGWPTKAGKYQVTIEAFGSLGSTDALRDAPLTVKAAPATGSTGQVHLDLDGKCLQAPKGAKVEITSCVAGSSEKWTVASDRTIRIGGHCLAISGSSGYSGKGVQLATCNGSVRELWTQGSKGELVSPASKLCLTDPGASKGSGVVPVMGGCNGKGYEQWTLPGQEAQNMLGECADDYHSIGTNGARIDNYGCNGTAAQSWLFAANGTIRNGQYQTDCLTAHKGLVQLYVCQPGDKSQQWAVLQASGDGSEFMQSGACVALAKLSAPWTTALQMVKCNAANPNDLWHIW